jgi:dGTPase
VGEDAASEIRKHLLEMTGAQPTDFEQLLKDTAKAAGKSEIVSLQAVSTELWDLIQWGDLELKGKCVIKAQTPSPTSADGGPSPAHTPSPRDKRCRDETRRGHLRRPESRIDRDRILQSWAFRRLEGVTQVVTPDHSGHLMHSRLTHSLKVGQVGRRIVDEILLPDKHDKVHERLFDKGGGLDADIVEAAGLAHDIGHPPFGHAGEHVLDEWARRKGLRDGFEGNAQTLRVLTRLEFRFSNIPGMNLTNATKAAVIKYPWIRSNREDSHEHEKFNAYDDDEEHLRLPRTALNVTGTAQTLEASIMDIADDITYALHDLEDFYTAGLFRRNHIAAILNDYSDQQKTVGGEPPTTDQWQELAAHAEKLKRKEPDVFKKELFDEAVDKAWTLVRFSMYRHFDGSKDAFALIRTAFAGRIDSYIQGITVQSQDGKAVIARLSDDDWHEIQVLKWLTRQFVVNRTELAITQLGQARLLKETLNRLYGWCKKCSKGNSSHELPITLAELAKPATNDKERARAVVDYVAMLTDAQLHSLSRALSAAGPPSTLYFV